MTAHDFTKDVIVITGATSGLGKGLALKLTALGAAVILAARDEDELDRVADQCRERGGKALAVRTDITSRDQVEALGGAALENFGHITVWINNAGIGAIGAFEEVPVEDHARVLETNLLGVFYGSHFAMRSFRAQGYGHLINIASMLGKIPTPYFSSYNASKQGVVSLGQTIRHELRQRKSGKISISTVLPMAMDTPFFQHAANYTGHQARPIPPVTDVARCVEQICRLIRAPRPQLIIGGAGRLASLAHAICPPMAEFVSAQMTRLSEFGSPLRGGVTAGNLYFTATKEHAVPNDKNRNGGDA